MMPAYFAVIAPAALAFTHAALSEATKSVADAERPRSTI